MMSKSFFRFMKKAIKWRSNYHFFLVIGIVLFFFGRLFFPEPKLFYTPDYGGSDIWHLNYPLKDFLSRSLKSGELPFWSKDRGTGFALFAEGQIGALYIFNILFFGLLPTWLAWNITYAVHFFLAFFGSYLFLKKLGNSENSSLLLSFSFSFGGFFYITYSAY